MMNTELNTVNVRFFKQFTIHYKGKTFAPGRPCPFSGAPCSPT